MDLQSLEQLPLVYQSTAFRRVMEQALDQGRSDAPLLILGETGTGKSRLARWIHTHGHRRSEPFAHWLALASTSRRVVEELTGVVGPGPAGKGLFRDGKAGRVDGGSLIVEHLEDASPAAQEVLLRIILQGNVWREGMKSPRPVDARLIFTTAVRPSRLVRQGALRPELARILSRNVIEIPPLRRRPEDVLPLAELMLRYEEELLERECRGFTPRAIELLEGHDWAGNSWAVMCLVRNALHRDGATRMGVREVRKALRGVKV